MDNRLTFPLARQPIAFQLTIHINNLIAGEGSGRVLQEFKDALYLGTDSSMYHVNNIIDYYGEDDCKDYFTLVYGWEFKETA